MLCINYSKNQGLEISSSKQRLKSNIIKISCSCLFIHGKHTYSDKLLEKYNNCAHNSNLQSKNFLCVFFSFPSDNFVCFIRQRTSKRALNTYEMKLLWIKSQISIDVIYTQARVFRSLNFLKPFFLAEENSFFIIQVFFSSECFEKNNFQIKSFFLLINYAQQKLFGDGFVLI